MAPGLITLDKVTKIYQTKDGPVESLRPLSFDIREGEFVSVVGPSGCGKSTLLKLVAGLLPITAGQLSLLGRRIDGPQKNVGIVFQGAVLLAWRTVLDNILLQAEIRHLPMAAARERALALIKMAGLSGFEHKYPWQLSGGMQQRVSICRALLHDPPVLLMDEPFGALDALTRRSLQDELLKIWAAFKKTIVFVTHSIEESIYLADRIIVMTYRPGTIKKDVAVTMARPRDPAAPEFNALKRQLSELVMEEQHRHEAAERAGFAVD